MINFLLRTKLSFRQNSDYYISVKLANNEQLRKNYTESPPTHECNLLLAFQSSKVTSLFSSVVSIGGKALEQFSTTTTTTTNFLRINVFLATEQDSKENQTSTRSAAGNCFFISTNIGLSDTQALDGYLLKTMKWKLEKKYIRHLV